MEERRFHLGIVFVPVTIITVTSLLLVWFMGRRLLSVQAELIDSDGAVRSLLQVTSALAEAETGQRGYLLTGDLRYLEPYEAAEARLDAAQDRIRLEAQNGRFPQAEIDEIIRLAGERRALLRTVLQMYRDRGLEVALQEMNKDAGLHLMSGVRGGVLRLINVEEQRQASLAVRRDHANTVRTLSGIGGAAFTLLFLLWAHRRLSEDRAERDRGRRELAESRQRLEGIVASAMDAIISVDEAQNIILFNGAAERVFKCSAGDALGRSLDRFIPARYRDAHHGHVRRFGETGQTTRAMGTLHMNLSGVRSDGEEFPIDASISQVVVAGQRIFTVILRDITQRRRQEEELKRLYSELDRRVEERTAELAAANRELEAFGYSVSHDLRAPLRHVTGFIELLDKHSGPQLDEKAQRYLRTISEASRRMGNLIDDLLTLSRIGRAALNITRVSIRQLVEECIVQLAPDAAGRRIEWKVGDLPEVDADSTLLRNVIMNLLGNALKYTRSREVAVIEVGCRREAGEHICFFRDNGVGFDMQFVDKLFGVFQRLHRPEEFEGTGIGLASVRRIIQRHGGRTWAEGEIDKGATVFFTLPAEAE